MPEDGRRRQDQQLLTDCFALAHLHKLRIFSCAGAAGKNSLHIPVNTLWCFTPFFYSQEKRCWLKPSIFPSRGPDLSCFFHFMLLTAQRLKPCVHTMGLCQPCACLLGLAGLLVSFVPGFDSDTVFIACWEQEHLYQMLTCCWFCLSFSIIWLFWWSSPTRDFLAAGNVDEAASATSLVHRRGSDGTEHPSGIHVRFYFAASLSAVVSWLI